MIECAGLYGRDLTSDPVQVLKNVKMKEMFQIFGRGQFSIMADFLFCNALGEKIYAIHII